MCNSMPTSSENKERLYDNKSRGWRTGTCALFNEEVFLVLQRSHERFSLAGEGFVFRSDARAFMKKGQEPDGGGGPFRGTARDFCSRGLTPFAGGMKKQRRGPGECSQGFLALEGLFGFFSRLKKVDRSS